MVGKKRNAEDSLSGEPAKKSRVEDVIFSASATRQIKLLEDGRWSDFTITCQDVEFKVHRAILSGHSDFIDKAMDGEFREASEQRLKFAEEDPIVVSAVLRYIYSGKFTISQWRKLKDDTKSSYNDYYEILIQLHIFADQILFPALRRYAYYQLVKWLRELYLPEGAHEQVTNEQIGDLTNLVSYVYGHDHAMDEMKQLLAWLLVCMDHPHASLRINDKQLETLTKLAPDLNLQMYRTLAYGLKQIWECESCCCSFIHPTNVQMIVVNVDGKLRSIACKRMWKGICSPVCNLDEDVLAEMVPLCESCCSHPQYNVKFWDDNGSNFCLVNQRIVRQERCSIKGITSLYQKRGFPIPFEEYQVDLALS